MEVIRIKKLVNCLVDEETYERIRMAAKSKGLSIAGYARMAILAMVAKEKK